MNYKFIVNPAAARGKCAREAKHVEELCRIKNLDYDMTFTEKPGHAIYLYSVLKTIYNYEPPVMRLKYNDVVSEEKIFMLTAGNGISLGGGLKLTPDAKMDDGLLDLNIISDLTKVQIYQNLLSVYSGSHTKMPQVTKARTTQLSIDSEPGFAVHLDGELMSLNMKSLNISIIPKALDVIVP